MLSHVTNSITDWTLPRRCYVCDHDLQRGIICRGCLSLCNQCPNPLGFDAGNNVALFMFEATIRTLIKRVKYFNQPSSRHLLLTLITQVFEREALLPLLRAWAPTAITYVPAHWFSRFVRGVELSSLFAYFLARQIHVPVAPLLRRTNRLSQAQRLRRPERLTAIKGAFSVRRGSRAHCERLLLVDDVITTGATLNEAAHMLHDISPSITRIAIAKTP